MNRKQCLAFLCPWFSLFIPYLVILDTSKAEENIGENLDEQIAFDVPGKQQPISFASSDHSTGYIVYCPCMGKWRNVMKTTLSSHSPVTDLTNCGVVARYDFIQSQTS